MESYLINEKCTYSLRCRTLPHIYNIQQIPLVTKSGALVHIIRIRCIENNAVGNMLYYIHNTDVLFLALPLQSALPATDAQRKDTICGMHSGMKPETTATMLQIQRRLAKSGRAIFPEGTD